MLTIVEAGHNGTINFGHALTAALDTRSVGRKEFAHELSKELDRPVNASSITQWASGVHQPPMDVVFAMERLLGLKAGALSRLLGYLPATARSVTSVEDALAADPRLDPHTKEVLVAAYRAAIR